MLFNSLGDPLYKTALLHNGKMSHTLLTVWEANSKPGSCEKVLSHKIIITFFQLMQWESVQDLYEPRTRFLFFFFVAVVLQ